MIKTIPLEPGLIYHIYNRGNNKETIFREKANYIYFFQLWKKHITPIADTFVYSLLNNHFHAMVRIKNLAYSKNLAGFENLRGLGKAEQHFSNFFNAYAKGFNNKYNRTGKLFEERFKRKPIINDAYFTQLIYYIHANPQTHGFVDDFRTYPHTSYDSILSFGKTNLMRDEVLDWFGGREMFEKYHADKFNDLKDIKEFEIE